MLTTAAVAQEGESPKRAAAERTEGARDRRPTRRCRVGDAAVIDDLHQVTPVEFAAPTERTIIYLLYDDDELYVGARMLDKEPEQITRATCGRTSRSAATTASSCTSIRSQPAQRLPLRRQPERRAIDGIYQNITDRQFDWDGIYQRRGRHRRARLDGRDCDPVQVAVVRSATGHWGINFLRSIVRRNEQHGVGLAQPRTPTPRRWADHGLGPRARRGLDIVPSLSVRERKAFATAPRARATPSRRSTCSTRSRRALNAALTINTDFSATEVDDRQVNLTRFGLFFPEKRDFFLREADIFEFASIGRHSTGNDGLENAATSGRRARTAGRFSRGGSA